MQYFTASVLTFIGLTLPAAGKPAPASLPEFAGLADAEWDPGPFGKEIKKDGKRFIIVEVPADSPRKPMLNCAGIEVDLTGFREEVLCFEIRARSEKVSEPRAEYNGVKFMLHYKDGEGRPFWHSRSNLRSFDWSSIIFSAPISKSAGKGRLLLGLEDSSGEVEFDLSSLRVYRLFPRVNSDYKIKYPEKIAATPPLRGVMSPQLNFSGDDLKTLHDWKVKLVRAQITRNWRIPGTERDLAEYDQWVNGRLDHFEEAMAQAKPYGIKFVIDLHTLPGGRDETFDMCMFYEEQYARHFIKVWERIAARFKGNDSVWAYDLVNEPVQTRPALYDYWTLQRMAAEAIRKIDPDTPIIVASNLWNPAGTYPNLAPLPMDNIIYQVHMYEPNSFTHQFIFNNKAYWRAVWDAAGYVAYPGMINGVKWDREMIRECLRPVRDFQLRHNARIYVGEFSAAAWAPGAADYMRDCIGVFEEYGWDWTYHAFRESPTFDVEFEGRTRSTLVPSKKDTDRKKVLLEAFKLNK